MSIFNKKKENPNKVCDITWNNGEPSKKEQHGVILITNIRGNERYHEVLHWQEFYDLQHQEGWYDVFAETIPTNYIHFWARISD